MNRSDLSEVVATELHVPKVHGERIVKTVLEAIADGLKSDGTVTLVHFGTFEVKQSRARTGRNPQTGEPLRISASRTVSFRPGKTLKAEL